MRLDDGALALAPRDDDTAIQRKERMPLHDAVRAADAAQLRAAIARVVAGVARARERRRAATAMRAIDARQITSGCTRSRSRCGSTATARRAVGAQVRRGLRDGRGGRGRRRECAGVRERGAALAQPERHVRAAAGDRAHGRGAAPRDAAHAELVGALADAGADLRAPDYSGDAPVHYAARRATRAVEALLARDAPRGQCADASRTRRSRRMGYTAADGAALATAHDTPLHLALEAGHARSRARSRPRPRST